MGDSGSELGGKVLCDLSVQKGVGEGNKNESQLNAVVAGYTNLTEGSSSASSMITTSSQDKRGVLGEGNTDCETRLWIGNLDPRLREYHLLKMVQRYGTIDNFDFLFHRSGPNAGLPRGYAFVTFQDKEAAERCLKALDGKRVIDKNVAVRWAHQATTTFIDEETKLKAKLPALSMKKEEPEETPLLANKDKAISAIEAKLKAMEREKEVGAMAGTSSTSFFYQYNKEPPPMPTTRARPRPYDRSRNNYGRRPYRR